MKKAFSPFKMSICPNATSEYAIKTAVNGWESVEVTSFEAIKQIATSMPYSSSFFKNQKDLKMIKDKNKKEVRENQRKKVNVVGVAPLAVFDIDDGLSIKETEKILDKNDYEYMIITTKSHGTEKAAGEDRFRLIMPLAWERNPSFGLEGITLPEDKKIKAINMQELKYLQEEIAQELGIVDYVDRSPLIDLARKYVPSPKSSICVTRETGIRFDIHEAGTRSYQKAKGESLEKRRKQEIAKATKAKNTSYSKLKDNKYKTYIDFGVLYSLDLGEVISHYEESEESTRFYTEGSYTYVHNGSHKYSIIFKEDVGEYQYHDFKSGIAGNIITYMREYFSGISNFDIALQLQQDFREELGKVKIIKTNPAYYIEPYKKMLKSDKYNSLSELKKDYTEEMKLKGVAVKRNGSFEITNNQGYKTFFKLDKELMNDFAELFTEFSKKKEIKISQECNSVEPLEDEEAVISLKV